MTHGEVWTAKQRASEDATLEPWRPGEVNAFANRHDKTPKSQVELFSLTCDRIEDLKHDIEAGDFSLAPLLSKAKEKDIQMFVADRLKIIASGKYTTTREDEVIHENHPDIRIHNAEIIGPVSIEIKIADNWSGPGAAPANSTKY